MKELYFVTAEHVHPDYAFNRTPVEVGNHPGGYSASHAKLGYVCDFPTAEDAIRDLFGASACKITAIEAPVPGLKRLTKEGRFECGLDAIVEGKVWAFVAVVGEHYGARLGIAIANERGYNPIPEHWAHADDYQAMSDHADELNKAEGLTPAMAIRIVASTMGGQRYQPKPIEQDLEPASEEPGPGHRYRDYAGQGEA